MKTENDIFKFLTIKEYEYKYTQCSSLNVQKNIAMFQEAFLDSGYSQVDMCKKLENKFRKEQKSAPQNNMAINHSLTLHTLNMVKKYCNHESLKNIANYKNSSPLMLSSQKFESDVAFLSRKYFDAKADNDLSKQKDYKELFLEATNFYPTTINELRDSFAFDQREENKNPNGEFSETYECIIDMIDEISPSSERDM